MVTKVVYIFGEYNMAARPARTRDLCFMLSVSTCIHNTQVKTDPTNSSPLEQACSTCMAMPYNQLDMAMTACNINGD